MKCGQFVIGPAGSGKSTYCSTITRHCEATKRQIHVVNLDPAAEHFDYPVAVDIRDLISLDDVVEELNLGPNGGLLYCMEFLVNNLDWLQENLGDYMDDYVVFDCPGQIELYTHFPYMRQLVDFLQFLDYRLCAVYIMDSQFVDEASKFFSGSLSAMSAMINLELPHINVLSKVDLLKKSGKVRRRKLERFLEVDPSLMLDDARGKTSPKFHKLNEALVSLIEDYSMVSFVPMDIADEQSVGYVLSQADNAIQYGEDLEPKEWEEPEPEEENETGLGEGGATGQGD